MTDAQFDSMMKTGLAQAVSDDSSLARDVLQIQIRKLPFTLKKQGDMVFYE